jgi:uncharacterized lipoprotein YajG
MKAQNKKIQNILDIPYEDVLKGIEIDNNWHEVIDAYHSSSKVRLFFDID